MMAKAMSLLLASAAVAACASPKPTPQLRLASEPVADICPTDVAATVVKSELLEDGTAYVFTTTGDVAELRRRVRLVARLHAQRGATDRAANVMAATDDVPGGARLNLRPVEAADVAPMQAAMPARAAGLAPGVCKRVGSDTLVAWLVSEPETSRQVTSR